MSDSNSSLTVYDVSRERVQLVVPTLVCISLLMVVGLVGNMFVVAVFGFRVRRRSTYRYFILSLAVYDLTACGVGMPGLLAEIGRPFLFRSRVLCKLLRYGFHLIAGGSSLTHTLVCIDRYRRICRATSSQIAPQTARRLCLVALFLASLFALPVFLMYDSVAVDTGSYNITGHICDVSEIYTDTSFPLVFNGLLSFCIVVTVVVMVVLYSLIGHRLFIRQKFVNPIERGTKSHGIGDNVSAPITRSFKNRVRPSPSQNLTVYPDKESLSIINSSIEMANIPETIASLRARKKQSREAISRKMTITTFALMVVFIVSFVPLEVLELVTLFRENIENEMTRTQLVFYHLGYHTYVINNMANPLVYIFMDAEFRRHCKELISLNKCRRTSK